MNKLNLILIALFIMGSTMVYAEDGSLLWLRAKTDAHAQVVANKQGRTIDVAVEELQTQWQGAPVQLMIVNTKEVTALGGEGFTISGNKSKGFTIAASAEAGLLYGAYYLLRLQETNAVPATLNVSEKPSYTIRILNHWDSFGAEDNTRAAFRGSFWKPEELPQIPASYKQYARANASIGINATVLNNVNASPAVLTARWLEKVKTIANELRPYNIKVYLSVDFATPVRLGELTTADPLNKNVQKWWKSKVDEIYKYVPDFGGFLMKANSEGTSGPRDYGRTHLDGANMMADALAPHKGVIMWRAFVYDPNETDRAKQAYLEFQPNDGKFRSNVIIQVKNGPVDFQPREPISSLFGAMQKTPVMVEFEIVQEYLGYANHLAYLGTTFEECLDTDTYAKGTGSTVAKTTDGTMFGHKITAISGVANIRGNVANWCGHQFAQANWYVFGRLAWNHNLSAEAIAEEWVRQTFTNDEAFVLPVTDMMMRSREAEVDFMMPLGLHHLFAFGHHYGPEPWVEVSFARPDWLPSYYHKADAVGLGYDRTITGSNAVGQYFSPLRESYGNLTTCDERFLLWFHHVPWTYTMKSGRTLWDELCYHYDRGVQEVRDFQKTWDRMEKYVDSERFAHVQSRLRIQVSDAIWWRDACVLYFQTFAKTPIPYNLERPTMDLETLKAIDLVDFNYREKADRNKEREKIIPKIIGGGY
ncbi:Extracellular xylan exo-alpha-(1-_2)-glucuronosidase [termite gut metagenome]|uniref:Extracellular xylan exo-alpha-(1->2)-glucuronosidase n=1 Tax=termite gut metagenome TaxID=433724 RepID=A0A5J4SN80_9ZZZZ